MQITWTASNNSSFLNGSRKAKTMLGAVRAAIKYANGELMGEGTITITIYEDGEDGEVEREYMAGLLAGTPRFKWIRTM